MHAAGVDSPQHLNLGQVEEMVGGESLRGRTGGAVTLAVGMALIFQQAFAFTGMAVGELLKYWYHFAIMFEALFILTTIDAGTRIARFLLQETAGRVYKPLARPDWLPGALLASGVVTFGYGWLISTGSIMTIWPMFGIANQLLAVLALALVTTWLVNQGRGRYAWVTICPMLFVTTTTLTAGAQVVETQFSRRDTVGYVNGGLTIFVIACVCTILLWAVARWLAAWLGKERSA
jgi:carbon starvation protein